jgi:hypothetical protein
MIIDLDKNKIDLDKILSPELQEKLEEDYEVTLDKAPDNWPSYFRTETYTVPIRYDIVKPRLMYAH